MKQRDRAVLLRCAPASWFAVRSWLTCVLASRGLRSSGPRLFEVSRGLSQKTKMAIHDPAGGKEPKTTNRAKCPSKRGTLDDTQTHQACLAGGRADWRAMVGDNNSPSPGHKYSRGHQT